MNKKVDIFSDKEKQKELKPLADRIRPNTLDGFIGQTNIAGPGKILSKSIKHGRIFSMILWGPPGTGKTTLARIIANHSDAKFYQLNAVASGVKDVRKVIKIGKNRHQRGEPTILFIDEIHRFNKAQQDALLRAVENGNIILIGATTENPSFEVIAPLLSRCRVLRLDSLSDQDLESILDNALHNDTILKEMDIEFKDDSRNFLINSIGGDARKLLNALETAIDMADEKDGKIQITRAILKEALQDRTRLYDKKADYHYDTISAFIKSVRGSDPDAALYWMCVMLDGGEDPLFIARRLIILASEDIGNANPSALMIAQDGYNAVHSVGMPEAEIILSQVTTYLASSPKSNASYMALQRAKQAVKKNSTHNVPLHLRNAPTKLMEKKGYGKNYKYPHDHKDHFVNEHYFPEDMPTQKFYKPTRLGRESRIKDRLQHFWPKRYKSNSHDQDD
ncbi:MAG: replication-associated recombination protein A [Candidatus Marinimicrobia bacterium]|nr:replication-associated recombination protein A [Candidatus Neomarinimicrobiota bacterium]